MHFEHNFIPCILTMASLVIALHYQSIVKKFKSCPVPIAFAESGLCGLAFLLYLVRTRITSSVKSQKRRHCNSVVCLIFLLVRRPPIKRRHKPPDHRSLQWSAKCYICSWEQEAKHHMHNRCKFYNFQSTKVFMLFVQLSVVIGFENFNS